MLFRSDIHAHPNTRALCCAYSKDSRLLASGGWDGNVKIYDTESFNEVITIPHELRQSWIVSLDFSSCSLYLATGTSRPLVHIFEVSSGLELFRFTDHTDCVGSLHFSSCGTLLASASSDETVRIDRKSTRLNSSHSSVSRMPSSA